MRKLMFQEGDKYGNFTFVAYADVSLDGHKCGLWRCGFCGNNVERSNYSIKIGKVKSCGCQGTYNMQAKQRQQDPDYCWEIICYRIKLRCERLQKRSRRATTPLIEFNITPDYLKKIYEQQQGKCAYTSESIYPPQRHTRLYDSNILSVDRIDSTIGYVEGNIQLVTKQINFMKQSMSHAEFIRLCHVVSHNHLGTIKSP